jgi:hypothetical protein
MHIGTGREREMTLRWKKKFETFYTIAKIKNDSLFIV